MFEVLVFMFENYFTDQTMPDDGTLEQELSEAGFEKNDILGAFDWYEGMKSMLSAPDLHYSHQTTATRIFTKSELKRINTESLGFLMFLQQAGVINDMERDLIIDRTMALKQATITIEEARWVTMMALWNQGREKDYSFVEDALFNPRGLTIQ